MLTLTPRQLLLAEEFLGNINEEGYLAASLEEILGSVNQLVAGHVATEASRGRRRGARSRARAGDRRRDAVRAPLHDGRSRGDAGASSSGSIRRASARATCASASCSSSASRRTPSRSPTGWCATRSPT